MSDKIYHCRNGHNSITGPERRRIDNRVPCRFSGSGALVFFHCQRVHNSPYNLEAMIKHGEVWVEYSTPRSAVPPTGNPVESTSDTRPAVTQSRADAVAAAGTVGESNP